MRYSIGVQFLKTVTRTSRKSGEKYDTAFFLAGWEGDETPQVVSAFPNDEVPIDALNALDPFEDVILTLSESTSESNGRSFKNYRLHELQRVEVKPDLKQAK
jgi:hypothetical protein